MSKYRFLTLFFLMVIFGFFFGQFLIQDKLPIPADTIVGLYHPFLDKYAANYPRGIPFKNFLITDPVRQQIPWRQLVVNAEKTFELPLWNPYSMGGYPLLANFQSATFNPLNLLFFLLPFSYAWSVLVLLQPLLAGIFLYFYLVNFKLNRWACILGSFVYAFCGFSVSWIEWGTIVQTAVWLPLILLAKEKLLAKLSTQWFVILLFAQCAQFFSGHLQIWFYSFLITNLYLFARIFQITWQKNQPAKLFLQSYFKKYLPFLLLGCIFIIITALQWLPSLQFINLSARDVDQLNNWQNDGWFLPWQHLIQFVAPDFFGNPATLNYWSTWNYGELVGYVGIIPLVFALFAMFFRRDKKTLFFGSVFFLSLIFALPTFLAIIPYTAHIPFLLSTQPTRLLFLTDFCLSVLTVLGMDYYIGVSRKRDILYPLLFIACILLGLWVFVLSKQTLGGFTPERLSIARRNLLFPTAIFIAGGIIILCMTIFKKKNLQQLLVILLVGITIIDLYRFYEKYETFTNKEYLFPNSESLSFLENHSGIYRIMETDSRIFPPNFSNHYHLQSIDGYDPLYLMRYGELIKASERGKPDITAPFGFNRIIQPFEYNSRIIDLLGVKYVLSLSDLASPKLIKVFEEGQTKVYENTNVLPRAFFVRSLIKAKNKEDSINLLFNPEVDIRNTAIVEGLESIVPNPLSQGKIVRIQYSENRITLDTENSGDGFLLLTDTFYPTWHAQVSSLDNSFTQPITVKIYRTDYNFRGIFIPKGRNKVEFYDKII